jgi:hypothetical protein
LELAGACIGVKLAWAFAEGRNALDVDQATSLLVLAVLSSRWVVRVVRALWELHHEGQPARVFPPDRYIGAFCYLFCLSCDIRLVPTLPYLTQVGR